MVRDNKALIEEIMELGAEQIAQCIQCGKCTAACPLGFASVRLIHHRLIGLIRSRSRERLMEESLPWVWGCTFCNRCTELCPKKANPLSVVLAIRRLQARELAIPMSSFDGLMSVLRTGHGVISEAGKELRRKVGLPEEPPSAISDPKALEEVKTILSCTRLVDMGLI